jgi:iron complex transport system substrate-binding protein
LFLKHFTQRFTGATLLFWLIAFHAASCSSKKEEAKEQKAEQKKPLQSSVERSQVRYAQGFSIEYKEDYKIIKVLKPWKNAEMQFEYVLVPRGNSPPAGYNSSQVIEIPLQSFACLSTTHIGLTTALGINEKLIGISGTKYVHNSEVRQLVKAGKIKEIGDEFDVDMEMLIDLAPNAIMVYGTGISGYDQYDKIREVGLKTIINAEYMETTPLGQAEWIKFVAAFFNMEKAANVFFEKIVNEYEGVKKMAILQSEKPTVFTGLAFRGDWTIPGGQSFAANYLKDAGVNYLWHDEKSQGNLLIDFEVILEKASEAEFWINTSDANSLSEIVGVDERYKYFSAWQQGNVFNNNAQVNESGGNDFWESGIVNPHLVLKDLVRIFHPALLPNHEFVYYKKLQ